MAFLNLPEYYAAKINVDGSYTMIPPEELFDEFTFVNILMIHFNDPKHLYVWIGKDVGKGLRRFIPQAKNQFYEDHPKLRMLRNFAFDQGDENYNFLINLEISREFLENLYKGQNEEQSKVIGLINEYRIERDDLAEKGKFEEAIEIAKKILIESENVVEEFSQERIQNEQEEFIQNMEKLNKSEEELLNQVLEESSALKNLIDNEDYMEAHKVAERIRSVYQKRLTSEPEPGVEAALSEEEKAYENYLQCQQVVVDNINQVAPEFHNALKDEDYDLSRKRLNEIKSMLQECADLDLKEKWVRYERKLETLEEEWLEKNQQSEQQKNLYLNRLSSMEQDTKNYIDNGRKDKAEKIISQYMELLENPVLNEIKDEKIALIESLKESLENKESEKAQIFSDLKEKIAKAENEEDWEKVHLLSSQILEKCEEFNETDIIEPYMKKMQLAAEKIKEQDQLKEESAKMTAQLLALDNEINDALSNENIDDTQNLLEQYNNYLENPLIQDSKSEFMDKKKDWDEKLKLLLQKKEIEERNFKEIEQIREKILSNELENDWDVLIENAKQGLEKSKEYAIHDDIPYFEEKLALGESKKAESMQLEQQKQEEEILREKERLNAKIEEYLQNISNQIDNSDIEAAESSLSELNDLIQNPLVQDDQDENLQKYSQKEQDLLSLKEKHAKLEEIQDLKKKMESLSTSQNKSEVGEDFNEISDSTGATIYEAGVDAAEKYDGEFERSDISENQEITKSSLDTIEQKISICQNIIDKSENYGFSAIKEEHSHIMEELLSKKSEIEKEILIRQLEEERREEIKTLENQLSDYSQKEEEKDLGEDSIEIINEKISICQQIQSKSEEYGFSDIDNKYSQIVQELNAQKTIIEENIQKAHDLEEERRNEIKELEEQLQIDSLDEVDSIEIIDEKIVLCQDIVSKSQDFGFNEVKEKHEQSLTLLNRKKEEIITQKESQKEKRSALEEELNNIEKRINDSLQNENIDEAEELIKSYNDLVLENKEEIEELEEKEIPKIETWNDNLSELKQNRIDIIEKLKTRINENEQKLQWETMIVNCDSILEKSKKFGIIELIPTYNEKKEFALRKMEEEKKAHQEMMQERREKAKELENIIETQQDVLPEIDEIDISDMIDDFTDTEQVLAELSNILDQNRVEVKDESKSISKIKTKSGEVIEIEKTTRIESNVPKTSSDSDDTPVESLKLTLNSGFNNTYDDVIEEAIIEDIIPYNFEITEIFLNGESPDVPPEKNMGSEGLSMVWKLQNIQPNENMEITYELRNRISRTILLPVSQQVKIIKTHKNIDPLSIPGLHEATLNFNNQYEQDINNLIIEDIIPIFYLYDIYKPEEMNHNDTKDQNGSLLKWNLLNVPKDDEIKHDYRLLELLLLEEIKAKIFSIDAKGISNLEEKEFSEGKEKYNEIVDYLDKFI